MQWTDADAFSKRKRSWIRSGKKSCSFQNSVWPLQQNTKLLSAGFMTRCVRREIIPADKIQDYIDLKGRVETKTS